MSAAEHRSTFRRYLPLLGLPAVLGPLGILGFIVVTEAAHDEDSCPSELVARRELAPGVVIEEQARNCLANVSERRYVLRRGERTQLLGRRRFAPSAFASPAYGWDAGIRESGEVHMHVENPGHEPVEFREGTAEEHAEHGLPK